MTTPRDSGFATAVTRVLQHLAKHTPYRAWVLSRQTGSDELVIGSIDVRMGDITTATEPIDGQSVERVLHLRDGEVFGRLRGSYADSGLSAQGLHPDAEFEIDTMVTVLSALAETETAHLLQLRDLDVQSLSRDDLTGLVDAPGWSSFLRSEEARTMLLATPSAVLLVDLDDLRSMNQAHGHATGDRHLLAATELLRTNLDARHLIARVRGDRLGVLMLDTDSQTARDVDQRIRHTLSAEGVNAIIGLALREPERTLEQTVADAEQLMQGTRNTERELQEQLSAGHSSSALALSLDWTEVQAWFQPIVDLRTGDIKAIEALARWHNTSLASEGHSLLDQLRHEGMLRLLLERILDDGLAHLVEFRRAVPDLTLAVNIEFDTLTTPNLAQTILRKLADAGLQGDALMLELSGRHSDEMLPAIRRELHELTLSGIHVLLDDLGNGFASLQSLSTLPISGVKVDRTLTADVLTNGRQHALITGVIAMAAEVNMIVVAEGVESQAEREALIDLRCQFGQGYLFSPAVPHNELAMMLGQPMIVAH